MLAPVGAADIFFQRLGAGHCRHAEEKNKNNKTRRTHTYDEELLSLSHISLPARSPRARHRCSPWPMRTPSLTIIYLIPLPQPYTSRGGDFVFAWPVFSVVSSLASFFLLLCRFLKVFRGSLSAPPPLLPHALPPSALSPLRLPPSPSPSPFSLFAPTAHVSSVLCPVCVGVEGVLASTVLSPSLYCCWFLPWLNTRTSPHVHALLVTFPIPPPSLSRC